jgi:hypothetical protein
MIAPVSSQIPCKQGIFQGIPEILPLKAVPTCRKCRTEAISYRIPYDYYQGKIIQEQGFSAHRSGKYQWIYRQDQSV